ncbi:glycosyltransferase family 2 protein [Halomarina ordinaria]|uniref:Glycosyltransferase family 2 protein n=1 Tax=Halomarina ordinaria TaxID=3033939 RepID=A0ABD5UD88_9EURY|nr:glycosyltransferase family 2 protein [Halomarina sp. PSRA2]
MYRENRIGVVIPAYNEEGFVGDVIRTLPTFVDRVYVVDDGSTDGTWEEIREYATAVVDDGRGEAVQSDGMGSPSSSTTEHGTHVVAIRHHRNRGVGGAIKTGYRYALADGLDIAAVFGADGQMDPDRLPSLLDPIVEGRADYAKGNRLVSRDYRAGMSRWRFFGNTVLSALTKFASGYWHTTDPQNGYTAISRRALERADIDGMYEYYGYCNDLLIRLNVAEMHVADVPIPAVYGDEVSHIRYPAYIWNVSRMLLRGFRWRLETKYVRRTFDPLVAYYAAGALALVAAVVSFVVALGASLAGRSDGRASIRGTALLAVGVLATALGARSDRAENEHLERRIRE